MEALKQHELKAEWVEDGEGPAVMLTQQDGYDEPAVILVHPNQLRQVCENFGIVAADEQAEKTIATLKRRLLALSERVNDLHYYIAHYSDHKHADLSYELVSITALADLAEEWCADFDMSDGVRASREAQPVSTKVQAPAVQGELL